MATLGSNTLYTSGNDSEHMLVIPHEAAQWLAEKGWSKEDVKTFLFEKARKPDCRTAYKDMGLLAVVPLVANEFGEGNCRW